MSDVISLLANIISESLANHSFPFQAIPAIQCKINGVQNFGSETNFVAEICNQILIKLVKGKNPFLTYNWLKFLYTTFGETISRRNMKTLMNSLLMLHRTLFAGDEMMLKLAFELWSNVIEIVHKLPGSSKCR